jgi:hypothetical protein
LQPANTLEVATELGLVNALLEAKNIPLEFLPGERFPVFSTILLVCHTAPAVGAGVKPNLCQYLYLPVFRAHVSVSSGFPKGFGFLGNLSRLRLRLVACSLSGERQAGYSVPHIHFV